MPATIRDRCDFFRGASVRCGACGKSKDFADPAGGGGDNVARKAGWRIEWRPAPFVRCPDCTGPLAFATAP